VLWPMMLLMFGIVQIGYAIWSQSTLAYAVDAATRHASLHGSRSAAPVTTAQVQQMVKDNATGMTKTNITVNVVWAPNNRPGSTVEVAASYPLPTLVSLVWTHPFSLTSKTKMLIVN